LFIAFRTPRPVAIAVMLYNLQTRNRAMAGRFRSPVNKSYQRTFRESLGRKGKCACYQHRSIICATLLADAPVVSMLALQGAYAYARNACKCAQLGASERK